MILGQSAGILAGLALEDNKGVHEISYEKIKTQLLKYGQVH